MDGEGRMLDLVWREAGGPAVHPPRHQGFGTTLLSRVVGAQHRGRVALDWRAEGLVCRLLLPEDEIRSVGADRPTL
jgi:two-component sensor histidine kinase